eukprot:TRINITY_DN5157_c0_g1_i1.p1 TRINITY_DN5157_c0_g1~~TRINITY_DN5157_c0_g1_i1.p1  ORF type:complete len:284 (+),score=0.92 TRINITY_DN5157_c0_g1_i1:181-1032(+)
MLGLAVAVGAICFLAGIAVFVKLSRSYKAEAERLAQVIVECEKEVVAEPIIESSPASSPLPTTPLIMSTSVPSGNRTPLHDVTLRSVGAMSRQMSGTSRDSSASGHVRSCLPTSEPSSPRGPHQGHPSHSGKLVDSHSAHHHHSHTNSHHSHHNHHSQSERRRRPEGSRKKINSALSRSYRDASRYHVQDDSSLDDLQLRSSVVSAKRKDFSHKLSDHILQMSSALQLAQGNPGAPMHQSHSSRSLDMEDSWSCEPRSPHSVTYERVWSPVHHSHFSHGYGKM